MTAAAAGKLTDRNKQLIRGLIYPVQFERKLEDGVERVISMVVGRHALNATSQDYLTALRAGLSSQEKLSSLIPAELDEVDVRKFLKRVSARLALEEDSGKKRQSSSGSVTLKDMARDLAEHHQLPKKQGVEMVSDLVSLITHHLKKGERVKISGLGILQVRKRAARMGRNPATGEMIRLKASKKVAFRPSKELKDAI